MVLRVVSWNCADHFSKKAQALLDLNPSFAIVPEVREHHAGQLGDAYATLWDGEPGNRGLLVAASEPWRLRIIKRATARHMVLTQAELGEQKVTLIGVWSMPGPGKYVGTVLSGLDELIGDAGEENVIVAGDFNASARFDSQNAARHSFDHIAQRLHAKGLHSLWHIKEGQVFGQETVPTYYHQWKREQPFHIDFMFASDNLVKRLKSFSIGDFDVWCQNHSDHAPLIAEFDLEGQQ